MPKRCQLQLSEKCWGAGARRRVWVFPSPASTSGDLKDTKHRYRAISEASGIKPWFPDMRDCYLPQAARDLLLPFVLSGRLPSPALFGRIVAGNPNDSTFAQRPQFARHVANRIQLLGDSETFERRHK